ASGAGGSRGRHHPRRRQHDGFRQDRCGAATTRRDSWPSGRWASRNCERLAGGRRSSSGWCGVAQGRIGRLMKAFVCTVLHYRVIALIGMAAWLAAGAWALLQLDIEAYPDPSPPLVDVITQNPSWSAEEMEQQVTVPIETALNGIPRLQYVRSISIFGLSDVKLYFDFDSAYFRDRQEVLNRLQTVTLPENLQPQLSPWSPVGEIYRYQLKGDGHSLNEVKAIQDWFVRRELKQVPGIIDVVTFGGTTKQYQAELDPRKLLQYNVTLPQVVSAISASNQ